MKAQTISKEELDSAIKNLIEEYRSMCLWFAPKDYPGDLDEQRLRALDDIERYGDREAFKRARELREWLLQASKDA